MNIIWINAAGRDPQQAAQAAAARHRQNHPNAGNVQVNVQAQVQVGRHWVVRWIAFVIVG
jgi:hypothetical protein